MGLCVETTVEAQQSPPTPRPCIPNPIAPPGKVQSPRALRCSSQCLALLGKDPGVKHSQLVVPYSPAHHMH